MTDIQTLPTPELSAVAIDALKLERFATARAALDELGMRLDSMWERLDYIRTGGKAMPTLDELAPSKAALPICYRPVISDRIRWVNNLVKQAEVDAKVVGL